MKPATLILGAGSGIGRAIADTLIQNNETLLVAHRDISVWDNHDYPHLTAISCDATNSLEIEGLALQLVVEGIKLKSLIFTVGSALTLPLNSLKASDYESSFQINTLAFFDTVRKLLLHGLFATEASIIAISSLVASIGARGKIAYAASKGALEAGIKSLALELAPQNIRVNAIAPGTVRTAMYDKLVKTIGQDEVDQLESEYPLGMGNLADQSAMLWLLMSNQSRWISGETFILDGGYGAR